uniref:glucosyltransferase domain-containing protein n=1 Tax=Acetatifactor sp. TaxID=1872090 RepID=UPI0040579348
MQMIKNEIQKLSQTIKEYFPFWGAGLIFSVVIYYLLISNQLVNPNDGLWEYNYYKAGSWSLSLGRWFWLYLDRLRFGISTEPLTSIITLCCFSAGFIFVLDLFELGKNKLGYLVSMLFLSSTAVCVALSYRFMSPTFGLAFLLNVIAAWTIIKWENKIASVVVSGGLIAFAMGLYQSFIGCTCVVLVGYFIYVLQKEEVCFKCILADIIKAFVSAALGGLLYVGILNLHLAVFHVGMSDYNGGSMYSLGNTIKNLPSSIANTYRVFMRYFIEGYFKTNVLQEFKIYFLIYIFALILLIMGVVKAFKISKIRALIYFLFVLAIPVASNAVLLIATNAWTSLLMTAPMALCIPILACVESKIISGSKKRFGWINVLLVAVLLYGNIYQVQIDQEAMLEGKIATTTMANDIIHDLNDLGYLDADLKYCVLGIPAGNEMFQTSVIYEKANSDALFGAWYSDVGCSRRSWQGVFTHLCGIDLEICTQPEYGEVLANESVQQMDVYPNEGYISRIGDIVVVKVSQ